MFDKRKINNMTSKLALIFIITTTILSTNIQYANGHRQCEHRYTKADEVSLFTFVSKHTQYSR